MKLAINMPRGRTFVHISGDRSENHGNTNNNSAGNTRTMPNVDVCRKSG